jgi:hypothetical protein
MGIEGNASPDLTLEQRSRLLASVYRELWLSCRAGEATGGTRADAERIEFHLDPLVEIVRRSTAERVEPYLFQVFEEICPNCLRQTVSGYCPLRHSGECALFARMDAIVNGIANVLRETRDTSYLAAHPDA